VKGTERAAFGWLRAAVLGANDGIVSTARLVVGVAAAGACGEHILLAGVAGLVAGAVSMAAGEYVSVSSQGDTEGADLAHKTDMSHDMKGSEEANIVDDDGRSRAVDRRTGILMKRHMGSR
jgi:VIT1/CCC1 family predicted Fe2+/Mn2+ transporter